MEKKIRRKISTKTIAFKEPEDFEDPYEYEAYLVALIIKAVDDKINTEEVTWLIREGMENGVDPSSAFSLGLDIRVLTDNKISDEKH